LAVRDDRVVSLGGAFKTVVTGTIWVTITGTVSVTSTGTVTTTGTSGTTTRNNISEAVGGDPVALIGDRLAVADPIGDRQRDEIARIQSVESGRVDGQRLTVGKEYASGGSRTALPTLSSPVIGRSVTVGPRRQGR
jgi:hypothetical protein